MSREDEIDYAKENGIPVPVSKDNPFSIDQNLWGRSVECGVLEDPWTEPPEEAFEWTAPVANTPDEPEYIEIHFEKGIPTMINGESKSPVQLVEEINATAGKHGIGRIDHIENRLVGIKSRENYESPAAVVLIKAHEALEYLTLPRECHHFKKIIEQKYSELVYNGLWYSQLKDAIDAFVETTQEYVTGDVELKMFKGTAVVTGRKSSHSLYDMGLATYDQSDKFDHNAAEGFIKLWGLPTKVYSVMKTKNLGGK
jgi:argininosuccinate synthase